MPNKLFTYLQTPSTFKFLACIDGGNSLGGVDGAVQNVGGVGGESSGLRVRLGEGIGWGEERVFEEDCENKSFFFFARILFHFQQACEGGSWRIVYGVSKCFKKLLPDLSTNRMKSPCG